MAGITAAQTVMAVAAMPAVMTLQGRLHRSAGTWHGRQCAPAGRHGGRRRSTFRRDRARRLADGSDWAKVIPLLQAKGVKVQAVQNGLNSLADDVAATRRAVGNQPGKAVLVGHSWGGTVITEAGADSKVAGLVYVAAFAPDAGQSTEEVGKDYAPAPGIGKLVADANGYLSLPAAALASDFAQDVPAAQARVMAATQGPIKATAFGERTTVAAWQSKPSWFIVSAHDCMIQPDLERAMARKIGAKVTTLPTSHVPQQSRPQDVAKVILDAVHAVEARN